MRRSHEEAIRTLQTVPAASLKVIGPIELADGVETHVAHGLGRAPAWVSPSAVRGPSTSGHIEELRAGVDRSRVIVLKASGYGATVTVEVAVL